MKIKDAFTNHVANSYRVEYVDDDGITNLLIKGEIVQEYLMRLYGNFETLAKDSDDFLTMWKYYNDMESFELFKMLEAFNSKYDPISNYDSTIHEVFTKGKQEEIRDFGASKLTTTLGATSSTTTNRETTPDNVTTFKNKNSSTTESDEIINNNESDARQDKVTNNSYIDIRDFTQKGNIGVTTSQQMIKSSLDLYKENPTLYYLDEFVKRYCYLFENGGC